MSWDSFTVMIRVHLQLEVDDHVLTGTAGPDVMDMLYPVDTLGQTGDLGNEIRRGTAVHQVVGGFAKGLVADVQNKEGGQAGSQGIHDAEPELGPRDTCQGRDGCDCILAVVLGDGQQRGAGQVLAGLLGETVEPFLDDDGQEGGGNCHERG